ADVGERLRPLEGRPRRRRHAVRYLLHELKVQGEWGRGRDVEQRLRIRVSRWAVVLVKTVHFHLQFIDGQRVRQFSAEQIVSPRMQLGPIESAKSIAGLSIRKNDAFDEQGISDGLDRLHYSYAQGMPDRRRNVTGKRSNLKARWDTCADPVPLNVLRLR